MPKTQELQDKEVLITITAVPQSLKELQDLVGGYIEEVVILRRAQPFTMIVDEEGLLKEKPINLYATLLAETTIVGNAVILIGEARRKFMEE